MEKVYKCVKELHLDKYDEDGFLLDGKFLVIPVGSRWKVQESEVLFSILGNEDNIHLTRIWKSKKAKTRQWIEISKERLAECFREEMEYNFQKGYEAAIKEMTDNLIRNSQIEEIDGKICLIVTSERIELVAEQMKKAITSEDNNEGLDC